MAILGFRQDPMGPPGAGWFRGPGGREAYAHAPDIASQFAQISPTPEMLPNDLRLALGGVPPTEARLAGGPGMEAPSVPDVGPNFGPPRPPPTTPDRTIPPAEPPPAPPELGQPAPSLQQVQREGLGDIMRSVINPPPGRARPAGWNPKSQTITREAGAPYDETQADERAKAELNVQRTFAASTEAQANRAEAEAFAMGTMRDAALERQKAQEAKLASMQRQYETDRGRVQGLLDATSNQQIDGSRWFTGNVFGGILAVIGQAMGQWAAIQSGTPNFAGEVVNRAIDRDIMSQRMEIEQGRVKSGNALQMLHMQMGDLDQAQAALKLIQQKTVDMEIARQSALTRSDDARNGLQKWLAERNQQYVKQEQDLYNASVGKITTKTDQAYQPAAGGGPIDPLQRLKRVREAALALKEAGVPDDQIAQSLGLPAKPPKGEKDLNEEAERYGKSIETAKLNEAEASLVNVGNMLEKYAGQKTIPGIGPEDVVTRGVKAGANFIFGQGAGEKAVYSKEERGNRQDFQFAKADLRHALTGAGMPDAERRDLDTMIGQGETWADLANAKKIVDERVAAHKASLAKGFSPEAVRLYESRGAAKAPMPERRVSPQGGQQ